MPLFSMLRARRTKSGSSEAIFDVTERFNQALRAARAARGEPDEGISRTLWEARRSLRRRPAAILGIGALVVAAGFAVVKLLQGEQTRSSRKNKAEEVREHTAA